MNASPADHAVRNTPSFGQGALIALLMALAGAGALLATQSPIFIAEFGSGIATLPFGLLTGGYLLYLRHRASKDRVRGSLSILLLWLLGAVALLLIAAPTTPQLLWHLAAITGLRGLLFHERLGGWVADGALTLAAATAAGWALVQSNSPLLALWTFFLLQAFWPELPKRLAKASPQGNPRNDAFDRAHEHATRAVRRLTRTRLEH